MRKLVLLTFLLAFFVGRTEAALSVVQAANNEQAASATTLAVTISTTSGNLLVIFFRQGSNNTDSTTTVSDSASQTWSQADGFQSITPASQANGGMFYKANSAAVTSVTITFPGSRANRAAVVLEISGAATSSPLDASVGNGVSTASITSFTSGSLTTTNASDILVFGISPGPGGTETAGTGFTIPTNGVTTNGRAGVAYKIVSVTQSSVTTTTTWTTATTGCFGVFSGFKSSGGPPPNQFPRVY